jgi:uncharacterized protein (DUF983 family)
MASYSISVFCPKCGRTEDGVMGIESINCAACGQQITTWDVDEPEDDDDDE